MRSLINRNTYLLLSAAITVVIFSLYVALVFVKYYVYMRIIPYRNMHNLRYYKSLVVQIARYTRLHAYFKYFNARDVRLKWESRRVSSYTASHVK